METSETEKSLFSKIDHVGVIVSDLDRAIEYYHVLGIGSFESPNAVVTDRKAYGKPAPDVKNKGIMAQMEEIGFELIQPISGKCVQREFLETRGEGISHLGFFVNDINKETARLIEKGFKVVHSWRFVDGGGGAYFDTDRVGGIQIEIVQWPPK